MPYANHKGVRIHYEVDGTGPPLVLEHGLGTSLELWRLTGFAEPLKSDYQLILVDPRGHGASDKPHDPEAYRMAFRVADVVAVLDDLQIGKAHYCGYSMGGWTGWGIAKYAPERFRSLVIGGASPNGYLPPGLSFLDLFQQGMGAFLAWGAEAFGHRWTPEVKAMFSDNDLQALVAAMSVRENLAINDLLPTVSMPCLLFGGAEDTSYAGAEQCARRMPNAASVSLAGLDHIEALFRPDLVIPHIRRFLAQVDRSQ